MLASREVLALLFMAGVHLWGNWAVLPSALWGWIITDWPGTVSKIFVTSHCISWGMMLDGKWGGINLKNTKVGMEIAQPISSLHLLCMAFLSPWWGKSKGGTAGWHKWREMYKLQSLPLLLTDYARKAYFHLNAFCHSGRLWNARLGKSVVSGELG